LRPILEKRGLKVIDENSIPYLVMGEDLNDFLQQMMDNRRTKLKPDELHCVSCHKAVKGKTGTNKNDFTGIKLGTTQQVSLNARCEICGTKINRFSSDRIEAKKEKERKKNEKRNEISEAEQTIKGEQLLFPYLRQENL